MSALAAAAAPAAPVRNRLTEVLQSLHAEGYVPRTLLDVGAHLGAFARDFLAVFPGCVPTLIEPNPFCQEALGALPFERHAVAASRENGAAKLFLTREWLQSTGSSLYRENTAFFRDEVVVTHEVPKARLDDLFSGRSFDFVKIDTQGSELDVLVGGREVLARADYVLIEVPLVEYNAGAAPAEALFAQLSAMGFAPAEAVEFHRLKGVRDGQLLQMDVLFERRARRRALPGVETGALAALAERLCGEGRGADAVVLLEHLHALRPDDAQILRGLAHALSGEGRTLEALERLAALKQVFADLPRLVADIRELSLPAIARFNAHVQAGEVAEAERYAAALAELAPQNAPMLNAALSCNQALGRHGRAARYAGALLRLDPDDAAAHKALAEAGRAAGDPAAEIEHRVALALSPRNEVPAVLRLHLVQEAAGLILSHPSTERGMALLRALVATAAALEIDVPPGSEWEGWAVHYRLLMEAIDLETMLGPTPPPAPPDPSLAACASDGRRLDPAALTAAADAAGAQALFFAAADPHYVGLYARWYALSILKHADVPALIVIHVIGGADALPAIAEQVGIADPRLVFTADAFDASRVTARCIDAPPKGEAAKPLAHFQSARFLRLHALLAGLGRPVFVSDIDLLLQRGVADLLARCADADVVLNENEVSLSAGSRLTANLVLANPTPEGARFACVLGALLTKALGRPAVTRWIDQVALLLARRHAETHGARIALFDTASDINNVMYPSWQANPFRFLSLYHGFDLASLEGAAGSVL